MKKFTNGCYLNHQLNQGTRATQSVRRVVALRQNHAEVILTGDPIPIFELKSNLLQALPPRAALLLMISKPGWIAALFGSP